MSAFLPLYSGAQKVCSWTIEAGTPGQFADMDSDGTSSMVEITVA